MRNGLPRLSAKCIWQRSRPSPEGWEKNHGLVQFRVTTWYFRFLDLVFSKLSVPPRLVCQITPVSWRKQTCAILSPTRPRGISKPLLLVPPRRWDLLSVKRLLWLPLQDRSPLPGWPTSTTLVARLFMAKPPSLTTPFPRPSLPQRYRMMWYSSTCRSPSLGS